MEDSERILLFALMALSLILPCHMGPSENPIKLDQYPSWYNPCSLEEVFREDPALEVDREQEQELYRNILEKAQEIMLFVNNFKDKMSNEVFKENYDSHLEKVKKQNWLTMKDLNINGEIPDLKFIPDPFQQGEIPNLNLHSNRILPRLRSMLQKIAVSVEEFTYKKYDMDDLYANTFYSMFKKLNQLLCEIDRAMFSLHIGKHPDKERKIGPGFKPKENLNNQNEEAFVILELYMRGINYTNKVTEYLRSVARFYAREEKE